MENDEVLSAIREAVVVRPGDTLVLRVSADMTPARFEELRDALLKHLPEDIKPLIIGGAIEQVACIRGDG